MNTLPGDGDPISMGVGALLAAIAFALRELTTWWVKARAKAKEGKAQILDEEAGEMTPWTSAYTLQVNQILRELVIDVGGHSAVIVLWQPTEQGGRASVIAEWSGPDLPSAGMYRKTEVGKTYREEVVNRLLASDGWVQVKKEDLTPGTSLSDHYDARGIIMAWLHLIFHREGSGTLFVSVRFDEEPTLRDSQIRDRISTFVSQR